MALVLRAPSRSSPTASLDPTLSLREAIDDFKKALTSDQKQQLRATAQAPCASSVLDFVIQIDLNNKSRAGRCVSSRLCTFLNATQQFASIVGTFVSSNPATAALIWGSVKFAILAASNVSSYFEKVTALLMGLGKLCPTYEKFAHLFPGCLDLQIALCGYYAVVVRLSTKILEVSRRPALAQAFSSVWTPFESEFETLQDGLKQASKLVQLSISLASQMAVQQAFEDQKAHHGWTKTFHNDARQEFASASRWRFQRSEREARKLRLAIKENLSKIDHLKPWRQARRDRVAGTAEWFQDDPSFQSWKSSDSSSTLWCSGTMGIGKTILASQMIANLSETREQSNIIAFHFCRADHKDSLLVRYILGSLARQMLDIRVENAGIDELQEWCDSSKDMDEGDLADFILCHLDEDLIYYVIIDGLDECEEQDVRLLTWNLTKLTSNYSGCLKLIYVSRPELGSIVSKVARPSFEFSITKERNESDQKVYIQAKLAECLEDHRLELSNPELVADISEALEMGSEGMFLWTRLLLEEICEQNSDNEILDTLKRLPRTMSELIDRKLHRIERRVSAEKALQVLQYCGVAKRPLTGEEFRELLGISIGQQAFDSGAVPNDMNRIISDCSGLVFADEEEDSIHYVHHSIRDYLFVGSRLSPSKFVEEVSTLHVGFLVLTYLNFSDFERQLTKAQDGLNVRLRPIDLGISSIAGSSRTKTKLAQIILELRQKNPSLPRKELARTGRQILATSNVSNEVHETDLLEVRFSFLNYARKYWIYHLACLNPDIHPKMWKLFQACVNGANPLVMRPFQRDQAEAQPLKHGRYWTADQTDPATWNDATYVAMWALSHGMGALALNVVKFKSALLTSAVKREVLWSIISHQHTLVTYLLKYLDVGQKKLEEVLVYAAKDGNLAIVEQVISYLPSVNSFVNMSDFDAFYRQCYNGRRPQKAHSQRKWSKALVEAAGGGHLEMVKLLCGAGAGINSEPHFDEHFSSLEAAAEGYHLEVVEFLLAAQIDLSQEEEDAIWQLWSAKGEGDLIHRLLRCCGPHALYSAAQRGLQMAVRSLLAAGAEVNAPDPKENQTALQAALAWRDLDMIELLLAAGADVNTRRTKDGQTSLYIAAEEGHNQMIAFLLGSNAHMNTVETTHGLTALHIATRIERPSAVKLLTAAGVELGARAYNGQTALHIAAECGFVDIVDILVAAGANMNIAAGLSKRSTPLYAATEKAHHLVVGRLVAAGADTGPTSLCDAARTGDHEAVSHLLFAGAEVEARATITGQLPLCAAAANGHCKVIDRLLDAKADVNGRNGDNAMALRLAAKFGHAEAVKRLLDAKADVNDRNSNNYTALHLAARFGHADAVKRLLDGRADVYSRKNDRETPLHLAARFGHTEVVRHLLNAEAEVDNRRGLSGYTALHFAADSGRTEVVILLLAAGANYNLECGSSLMTALELARNKGHTGVSEILVAAAAADTTITSDSTNVPSKATHSGLR